MKKELDMRLLNQITGGADEMVPRIDIEPVLTVDAKEDNTNTRWRNKYRVRPRTNTTTITLEPVDTEVLILDSIIIP